MDARVHSIPDEGLGNTSYVVEVARGLAVSVDPPRDADTHLSIAERAGGRIAAVLETHVHADFVTGSLEIAETTGATIHAAGAARVAYPHSPVEPNDVVRIGEAAFHVMGTPGHTPEHIAFVLEQDGHPRAIFTGGSLIAGGVARTDLSGDALTEPLARSQFHSIRAIAALPGHVALHPTHGGGSFCSAGAGRRAATTIADEQEHNYLLRIEDEGTFVARFLSGLGSFPPYFFRLPAVNRDGPPLLCALDPSVPLTPDEVARAVDRGAHLIDARPVEEWARGHPRAALSIQARPQFASWLGWAVPFGAPIVIIADEPARTEVMRQARRIGYDRVLGWLDGGADAWREAGREIVSTPQVGPQDAGAMADDGAVVLDVRQMSEWEHGRIPGARHLELGDLIAGKGPEHGPVVTYCGHGERSATAASVLERHGLEVANLAGGFAAWKKAGLPVEG